MHWKRAGVTAGAACTAAVVVWIASARRGPETLVLTGVVTTEEVVVSPEVAGRLVDLTVREGDAVVRGQRLAGIEPAELKAEGAYYARSAEGLSAQVAETAATLRYQERESAARIRQARAGLASAESDRAEAAAQFDDAQTILGRQDRLASGGAVTEQDRDHARTMLAAAGARVAALEGKIEAQRAALDVAKAGAEQVAAKRASLLAARGQQAAVEAQRSRADVRLAYASLFSPIAGVVDVRVARAGEHVAVGQPVVTLVDPDDLWVRADVEEGAIGRVRLGDRLEVRLPSGESRTGEVFFRGVDAAFATQRDVSRTKRDIRTFEIRLRVDNVDRRLALGSTVSVLVPERR